MPRGHSRAPRHPSRVIAQRIIEDALRVLPTRRDAFAPYEGTLSSEPIVVTEPYEAPDGTVETRHPAFYDIDEYDDPTAIYLI